MGFGDPSVRLLGPRPRDGWPGLRSQERETLLILYAGAPAFSSRDSAIAARFAPFRGTRRSLLALRQLTCGRNSAGSIRCRYLTAIFMSESSSEWERK